MPSIAVFGDVHGHLDKMIQAIDTSTDFVLQVGDFGVYLPTSNLSALPEKYWSKLGKFPEYFESKKPFPVPVYFCKGNHEDFELLETCRDRSEILPNLFYVANGRILEIQGLRIAFLGGNFSPKWFEKPMPKKHPNHKVFGYLRKYEIEEIMRHAGEIDILVTHEPSFGPQFDRDQQYGCQVIQELIEVTQPAYAFSGHIHKYAEGTVGKTKCIALGAVPYQATSVYQLWI